MEIEFYHKDNGDCPVIEYLDSLSPKLRAKNLRTIMLLEEFGNRLRMPYSEHLDDGIFELRTVVGTDITRVFYFFVVENKAVLTHGLIKKTQRIPSGEIKRAKEYRADYIVQQHEQ